MDCLPNAASRRIRRPQVRLRKRLESVRTGTRTSWGELSEKSVHNFATAQKSLMGLVVKPEKAAATATPHERKRKPIHHAKPSAAVVVHERKSA